MGVEKSSPQKINKEDTCEPKSGHWAAQDILMWKKGLWSIPAVR